MSATATEAAARENGVSESGSVTYPGCQRTARPASPSHRQSDMIRGIQQAQITLLGAHGRGQADQGPAHRSADTVCTASSDGE
jgi:hypothetical protein